ncbi:MAG: HEAT repeat domain-containing protein, partial [Planctomycetota bacterium]
IGEPEAVLSLIRVLTNRSKSLPVRQAAAGALGKIGDPRALQPLNNALKEPSLRSAAAAAIEQTQVSIEWDKEQEEKKQAEAADGYLGTAYSVHDGNK